MMYLVSLQPAWNHVTTMNKVSLCFKWSVSETCIQGVVWPFFSNSICHSLHSYFCHLAAQKCVPWPLFRRFIGVRLHGHGQVKEYRKATRRRLWQQALHPTFKCGHSDYRIKYTHFYHFRVLIYLFTKVMCPSFLWSIGCVHPQKLTVYTSDPRSLTSYYFLK